MDCSTPGFPVLHHLPELAQTHVHLIFYYPLLLLPSIFSSIRVFSNELALRISGQSIGASGSALVLHRQKTGLKISIFYFKKFIFIFSLQWLLLLQSESSRAPRLQAVALRLSSVAHGLSCSAACGILPDQGSTPCSLPGRFLTPGPPGRAPNLGPK